MKGVCTKCREGIGRLQSELRKIILLQPPGAITIRAHAETVFKNFGVTLAFDACSNA